MFLIIVLIEIYAQIFRPSVNINDEKLGWKLKKNFTFTFEEKDFYNESYEVNFETDTNGLRPFGNLSKNSKKILILGDSFSNDPYSSNEKMWYAILANKLEKNSNFKFGGWSGGAGGYGSLQQLLFLDEIMKKIKPDFFILQFCSNDFMNNHQNLELEKGAIGQYSRRPYINQKNLNEINFNNNFLYKILRTNYFGDSKVLNKIIFLYSNFKYNKVRTNVDENIKKFEEQSIVITEKILEKIGKKLKYLKPIMVNCSSKKIGQNKYWEEIGSKTGFIAISDPSDKIEVISKNEKIYFRDGAHFNELGNKIYGEVLANAIINNYSSLFKIDLNK
jgi:lysophospholipase L1-like esterase